MLHGREKKVGLKNRSQARRKQPRPGREFGVWLSHNHTFANPAEKVSGPCLLRLECTALDIGYSSKTSHVQVCMYAVCMCLSAIFCKLSRCTHIYSEYSLLL